MAIAKSRGRAKAIAKSRGQAKAMAIAIAIAIEKVLDVEKLNAWEL
jgi:hypothetical protein